MHIKKQSLAVMVVAGVAMLSHKAQAKLGNDFLAPKEEEGDIDLIVSGFAYLFRESISMLSRQSITKMRRMMKKSCLFPSKSERRNSQQPHCKIMNFLTVSGEEELLEELTSKLWEAVSLLVLAESASVLVLAESASVLVLAESASVLVLSGLEELSLSRNLIQGRDHAPKVGITHAKPPRKATAQRRAAVLRSPTHTRAVVPRNHIRGGAHGQRRVALTRVILENPGLSRGREADLALEEEIT